MEGFLCLLTGCEIWIQNANANLTIKQGQQQSGIKGRAASADNVYIN